MLSEAKHRAMVFGVYVRSLVVFATRDDSEWEVL